MIQPLAAAIVMGLTSLCHADYSRGPGYDVRDGRMNIYSNMTNEGMVVLDTLPGIRSIRFMRLSEGYPSRPIPFRLDASGMAHVGMVKGLEELEFVDIALDAAMMKAIMPVLERVKRLRVHNWTDDAIAALPCTNLEHFMAWVGQVRAGDGMVRMLARNRRLREAELNGSLVTDDGLLAMADLKELKTLHLDSSLVGDRSVSSLSVFSGLQSLSLAGTKVTDASMGEIAKLQELRWLDLSRTEVQWKMLANVSKMKNLTHLALNYTKVEDEGLSMLVDLTAIEELELNSTRIKGSGLAALSGMKKLRILYLGATPIDDAGFRAGARGLPKSITQLFLNGTQITDASMRLLPDSVPALTELTIGKTSISDQGLDGLVGMQHLSRVTAGTSNVTRDGVAKFAPGVVRLEY